MEQMPRDWSPDNTLALMSDGYEFIRKRCERYGTDVFETRLMLQSTICMHGAAAAEIFYDTERFKREKAAPRRLKKTLFGSGAIQNLDDERHRSRKAMFMSMMTRESIERLVKLVREQWHAYTSRWERIDEVVLFEDTMEILCRAVCAWAGVPLAESEVELRTSEMADMIDAPGRVGPRYLLGRLSRGAAERWAGELVGRVRAGTLRPPENSALSIVANFCDVDGDLLDTHDAAVELLNVIRPTVAISRYVVFSALALHAYPHSVEMIREGGEEAREFFVQEVRRFYPFFPFAAARVRKTFSWRGYEFEEGTRAMLDLFGTNRDPRIFKEPDIFQPDRFADWEDNPYNFIPQGGGDFLLNHRCAGEWITIALMKDAVEFLVDEIDYDVPPQNLEIDLSRMPAIPESRFVIANVRRVS